MKLPKNPNLSIDYSKATLQRIVLAGGCFWGVEAYLARIPGVAATLVGYANGHTQNPTYEEVCAHKTGFAEAVQVDFDPNQLPLLNLLASFFEVVDPTSVNRQGNDIGDQYRSGIYYLNEQDRATAEQALATLQAQYSAPIATQLEPLQSFYPAEEYHQKYLEKNPNGYCHIHF